MQATATTRTTKTAAATTATATFKASTGSEVGAATAAAAAATRTTSLIYLPPFCYPCKHVPAASTLLSSRRCSSCSREGKGEGREHYHFCYQYDGSCCCCQQRWEHKNYDKHATAATLTAATRIPTITTATKTTNTVRTMLNRITPNVSRAGDGVVPGHADENAMAQNFLQRIIQLPMLASTTHSSTCNISTCSDLRQQQQQHTTTATRKPLPPHGAQLVMPIVVEGAVGGMECQRRQRRVRRERERERERRPSHASVTPNNAAANPISNVGATINNSQTTTTTTTTVTATATARAMLTTVPLLNQNDDECRCFNYNGDISTLAWPKDVDDEQQQKQQHQQHQQQQQQLPRRIRNDGGNITWLKFWQQLLLLQGNCFNFSSDSNFSANTNTNANATTKTKTTTTTTTHASYNNAATLRMTSTKSWLGLLLMLLLTTSVSCWGGRQDAPTNCSFPARWEGSWFLSGYQQSIHIKGSQFSYRGRCTASDGNKFLIVDEKGCHRCLVIYEKHKNVLQYKESECEGDSMYMHQSNPSALAMRSSVKQSDHRGGAHPNTNGHSRLSSSDQYIMRSNDDMNDYFCKGRETLQNLCDQIPGDALLYSLFRESAEPVKCPLKGPFIFTYNRGHGECKFPVSNIESCTEDSRLLLSFQACPDVLATESTVEELTCLATWKDGNSRYLVGLVSHHHAISNEERYRCFVYEKISALMGGPSMLTSKDAEYKLAQSGDATCNGLDSADVGSRIMSLRKPPVPERCDFPAWFKGPRHWHALMGNPVYNFHSNDGSVHIIKPNGYMETRAFCEQINKQTATEMMAVVHYTTGCQSGFMCMMFYRRDTHVIEIQTGKPAIRLEDACAPDHFDINKMAYITLLASNPDPQICPMEGLYNLRGAIGPPYQATRHKRNHNGKTHLGHGHHHHESADAGGFGHKGHSSLSFRNAEHIERGSWRANTRGLPVRSRRNVPASAASTANTTQQTLLLSPVNETNVDLVATRNRRDVPGCVTNYKAQRQLWVGCTAPNLIDVRPQCNEDGEEEYSCHGSWTENGTTYIIARHKSTKHGVCISYRPTEGTAAKLVVGDACYRGSQKPPDHHLVANLSVFGKCGETGSGAIKTHLDLANWLVMATVASLGTWRALRS
ncbi:uncharacterized protein LOC115623902 isoform X2 [Scaptodrosophila lebanonensis]|uniref:Uncharacterized protein LOC115623902 isoform X2 n=1 Tax=Drosophila lebanonensis TaxID=7225 RepID=A0A6J2TGW0_DROLE|nr:uncharacterized protein LOC115623902 isoform X2 [Scaptodrosophila lebanonensis]